MGFLDNSSITIDAVLTKYGKEKLASGQSLGISHFGGSDDGIHYGLWNEANTAGSDKYGQAIEDMPMMESPVIGRFAFRYKLGTGVDNLVANPYIILDATEYTLKYSSKDRGAITIEPQAGNMAGEGMYTFEIAQNSGVNVDPGGKPIDKQQLEAPLPERDLEEAMIIGPTNKITVSPMKLKSTVVSAITITEVNSGAMATVRLTCLGGDKQDIEGT